MAQISVLIVQWRSLDQRCYSILPKSFFTVKDVSDTGHGFYFYATGYAHRG